MAVEDALAVVGNGEQIKARRRLDKELKNCIESTAAKKQRSKKRLVRDSSTQDTENVSCQENQENETLPKRLQTTQDRALAEISNLPISDEQSSPAKASNSAGLSHVSAAKAALHLSAVPGTILCRNEQMQKVVEFAKSCLEEQKPGSLYVCGCPGTGKSLTMEKLKGLSSQWADEAGVASPEVVNINCTTLTDARQIYHKIFHALQPDSNNKAQTISLEHVKKILTFNKNTRQKRMQLLIIDEMDYLITREQSVLYDLFQLSVFKGSSCILIGVANAIDLTERFLPKLRTLNCHPDVVTFPAYSKAQILAVLNQRLSALQTSAFHPAALDLCARKVSAASGDMRKAMHASRIALDLLESEVKDPESCTQQDNVVQVDHMARALAKIFRSPVIETVQALPQHSQMVLCSAVRLFRSGKKDAPLSELHKSYLDFCKTTCMRPISSQEFFGICQLIADQGLLSLSKAREDRLRKTKLQVDPDDILFALQGIRFFRNNLL